MAKIGTAHIEIKPVLNEEALESLAKRIEDAVAAGVERGMAGMNRAEPVRTVVTLDGEAINAAVAKSARLLGRS